jgi:biotin transport system permease protein
MLISTYQPGTSPLHRWGAGAKLLGVLSGSTLLMVFRSPFTVLVGLVVVVALYGLAGFGPRLLVSQAWPLRWFVLILVPFQWLTAGWQVTLAVVGTLVVAVVGAALLTLTTRVTDILEVIARVLEPFRRWGVDPDRVALLLALTIRAVPVVAATMNEARDARRARGLERSTRALVTPIVVRTIRHADRVGDALAARGIDD